MSYAKHTPGPWEAVSDHEYHDGWDRVVRRGVLIASCSSRWHDNAPPSERPANAKLIAAAPELAAACEVFANIAQDGGLMKDLRDALRAHEQDAFTRACNAALAALQKAGLR